MNKKVIIFILIIFVSIGCKKKYKFDEEIPDNLGEMELEQVIDTVGNPFKKYLTKGHIPSSGVQAKYIHKEATADLYIVNYPDTLSAIASFHNIMKMVKTDTVQFKHVIPRFNNNIFYLMAMSNGRLNYFFTKSTYVYWLNCDKTHGEKAIKELIEYNR